jgi:hypothetical protein
MTFLLLRGRRFGKPFPLREDTLLREPVEYIKAIANLLRRSGQRVETLAHYRQQFRRHLGKRYAIDPTLSDNELVQRIAARDSSVDTDALRDLLHRLSQKKVSEQDLIALVAEMDTWK